MQATFLAHLENLYGMLVASKGLQKLWMALTKDMVAGQETPKNHMVILKICRTPKG